MSHEDRKRQAPYQDRDGLWCGQEMAECSICGFEFEPGTDAEHNEECEELRASLRPKPETAEDFILGSSVTVTRGEWIAIKRENVRLRKTIAKMRAI